MKFDFVLNTEMFLLVLLVLAAMQTLGYHMLTHDMNPLSAFHIIFSRSYI